jgi:environmental stress-induced protein Ves
MNFPRVVALDSACAEPWKNGGGITRTLACVDGEWRVSVAHVARNGPYSIFAGMTRLSLIIRGQGVVLRSADAAVRLEYLKPSVYDGETAWDALLIDAEVVVLNVMARTGRYRLSALVVGADADIPAGCAAVILAGQGSCRVKSAASNTSWSLMPGETLAFSSIPNPLRIETDPARNTGGHLPIVALIEPIE